MGEDSEGQPLRHTGSGSSEKLAALTARVAALERQIATLSAALAESTGEPPALANAAPPPAPTAGPGTVFAAAPPPKLRPDSLNAPVPTFAAAAIPPATQESLERRLGSQVFSRVGIIALLIGATWFLKLAIDNGWLGPTGRVLAGLIAGTGLVVWSERFRLRGYAAFSYSLKAVGSGVLYLSLWAAFQLYHLLPAEAALAAMLLVSAWNAYMAWAQNAEVLAAYALIGGLATPLLLSTGGNHENFLFIYLLAIDVATIVLVRLRPWSRLLLGVFPATVVYFIGWYIQFYRAYELTVTSIYITLFFLVFASVPWRGVVDAVAPGTDPRRAEGSVISEILLPLANAAFGSLAFYSVLHDSGHPDVLPWMVLLFAAAYLGMVRLPQSAAASAVHLSLAIVFITIAIPLKASGHWITVSWLVEGAVLMWVAARLAASGPVLDHSPADAWRVLRALAVGALLLGLGGLLLQMYSYDFTVLPAFFNHRFATALIGIAAFSTTAWVALHARQSAESEPGSTQSAATAENEQHIWLQIGGGSIIAVNVIAILATVREISAQWSQIAGNPEANLQQALAISAFLMLYGAALLTVGFWKRTSFIRWQALALIVFTIAKTFLYDMRDLSQGYRVASFMALGALLLGVSFAYQNDWLALRNKKQSAGLHSEEPR
jgi:uncharacterized membrane protein